MNVILIVGVAVLAAGFVMLAFVRPRVSLLTLVALDVSNLNTVIADHVGISPYRAQLALAVLVLLVMVRRRRFRFYWSPVLLGLLILLAGFCLSLLVAADPATSQALLASRARDVFYAIVVLALIWSTDAVREVVMVSVLVLAALAALTVFHQFVLHNSGDLYGLSRVPLVQEGGAATARHAGTSSDVNFWARLLILFTPLAFSLAAADQRLPRRVGWLAAALSLGLGVYLTQSRGGFLALFAATVLWLLLAGRVYRRSLLFAPLVLVVLVPLSGIGSRLGTLGEITSGTTAGADLSLVTRQRLQLDAWRMFLDSPLTGHGIGSYVALFPQYDRLSNFYQPVDIVVAAHNFYLEQAADGGIALLLAWALFLGTVVFAAWRARLRAAAAGDSTTGFLAVGVLAGLAGWLVASVFLHLSDFRALLLVAVVAAALDRPAAGWPEPVAAPAERAARRPDRALALGLGAVLVAATVGLLWAVTVDRPAYTATVTLGVVPSSPDVNGSVAYQLDVVSRGQIVPTLATVLDRSLTAEQVAAAAGVPSGTSTTLSIAPSRLGGSIDITVGADDPSLVPALADAAVGLSQARVAGLDSGYRLTEPAGETQVNSRPLHEAALAFSVLIAASGLALLWLLRRSRVRARSSHTETPLQAESSSAEVAE